MTAACPTCGRGAVALEELLVEERIDRQNAESEIKRQRREIGRLKSELAKQRVESPDARQAREVFEHWAEVFTKNGNVVFGPAREKAVLARLQEYPVAELLKAVDGCALMPFVGPHGRQAEGGKGAKRHDDLALICRDETTVERFAGYVDDALEATRPKPSGPVEPRDRYGENTDTAGPKWHSTVVNPDWSVDVQGLRLLLERLAARDLRVVGSGAKFTAQCPAHDDRDPSLSIFEKTDGRVLIYCHAGCQSLDVLQALDMEFADIGGACALSPSAAQRTFGAAA